MPTYEYRCGNAHQYEKREGFDAPARQKCPKCGKPALRMLNAPTVVFKGSGFYKTDSRGSSQTSTASNGDATKADASKAETTKTTKTTTDSGESATETAAAS